MDNAYKPDLITLIDEDNVEHNFEILDTIENEKVKYISIHGHGISSLHGLLYRPR